jgi:hypothetical protein
MRQACPSRASCWSSLITHWGFPCCARFPCVHAAASTPVQQLSVVLLMHSAVSAFPGSAAGSACTLTFSRFAQRSLTLRPAHAHGHQCCDRYPKASDISSPPCLLRLLPAGAFAGRGLHPLESAALSRRTPEAVIGLRVRRCGPAGTWYGATSQGVVSRGGGLGSLHGAAPCRSSILLRFDRHLGAR